MVDVPVHVPPVDVPINCAHSFRVSDQVDVSPVRNTDSVAALIITGIFLDLDPRLVMASCRLPLNKYAAGVFLKQV